MDITELQRRLVPFCRAKYGRDVRVFDVHTMPGHAGFSYGFSVDHGDRAPQAARLKDGAPQAARLKDGAPQAARLKDRAPQSARLKDRAPQAARLKDRAPQAEGVDSWFIRLPPPNVNWRGTADVLRQVAALNALAGTAVPHCTVRWSGDDLEWFGCPYFVVPKLDGDVLRLGPGEWAAPLAESEVLDMGRQVMTALAGVHKVDPAKAPYLGHPVPFKDDVERWDRFYERAADPECLARVPDCRRRLLETLPADAPVGIFHGDFQTSNLLFAKPEPGSPPELLAVIDWELTGIGATLNDVGWICTFSDREAWAKGTVDRPMFLDPETLMTLYVDAFGDPLPDLNWFRALAAYKFAIITGFNLSLHRRGKRVDSSWEVTRHSMTPLIDRALELLG